MVAAMRWRKLGRIFVADGDSDWVYSHGIVPIARPLDQHRYRIYFSPRDRWNRSNVSWLDIDIRRPTEVLALSEEPVLKPGALGFFDDRGAMVSWIVDHGDEEWLYYQGWNVGAHVPFHAAIGLAVRTKGASDLPFRKVSNGPLLDRSLHEPVFLANPTVLRDGAGWRMWYQSGQPWREGAGTPLPSYFIRTASSDDGLNWTFPATDALGFAHPGEMAIACFCPVREADGRYSAWFSYRGDDWPYKIGYAYSPDGVSWTRRDEEAGIHLDAESWEEPSISYPFVFDTVLGRHMLYNAGRYGSAGFGIAVLDQD